jgi:hypothetical protein
MAEMNGAADPNRYLCSQLVTLSWEGGETIANLEEIQAGGGVLESDAELIVGAAVQIVCGTVYFEGEVTKAEGHAFGWRVAVEFSPATPWSMEQFRPEHFFDPAAMSREAT